MGWFEFHVAAAQLRASRHAGFVSLVSMLSMLGVAVAVALLVVVLSVMNGFDQVMRERILSVVAHGSLHGTAGQLQNWDELRLVAAAHPEVKSVAPFIEGQGLLSVQDAVAGAQLLGFGPDEPAFEAVGNLTGKDVLDLLEPGEWRIVLGSALAERLGLGPGDDVLLMLPQAVSTPAGSAPRTKSLSVAGTFHAGMSDFDESLAWVHYEDASRLFRLGSDTSGLRVMLYDPWRVEPVLIEIARNWTDQLYGLFWTRQHAGLFSGIAMTKQVTFIILTLLVAIAAFNIVSSLVMIVRQKTADIGILRTLGSTPRSVMTIFVFHGGLAGIVGVLLGLAVGLPLAAWAGPLTAAVEDILQTVLLGPDYGLAEMPSRIVIPEIVGLGVMALLLSLIATVYPALRAARTDPAYATRRDE